MSLTLCRNKNIGLTFCQRIALKNKLICNNLILLRKESSVVIKDKNVDSKPNIVSSIICDKNDTNVSKTQTKLSNDLDLIEENEEQNDLIIDRNKENKAKNNCRYNPIGIQMISSALHKRIFGQFVNNDNNIDSELKVNEINDHLELMD